MKERPTKRRSLLRQLSLQLIFAVAVPVVIILFSTSYLLMSAVTDEIAKSAAGQLKVAYGTSQMMEGVVLNAGTKISSDARLERLTRTPHFADISRDPETQFAFMEFLRDLGELVRTDSLFHSIHIVVEGVDWIISSLDGVVLRAEFSDRAWLDDLLSLENEDRSSPLRRPHIPAAVATIGSGQGLTPDSSNQTLVRLYPLNPYVSPLSGWIILEVDEREFSRRINSANFGTEGSIAVVDSQGVYLTAVERAKVGRASGEQELLNSLRATSDSQGFLTLAKPDGDHLLTWYRPPGDLGTFVGDFSLAHLNRSLDNLRLMTLGLSLAILVVGIVGMALISRRFFSPVRRMVEELRAHAGGDSGGEGNELALLENALAALIKQDSQLFSAAGQQLRIRAEDWALKALRGVSDLSNEPVPESLSGKSLSVGLLLIDGAEAFVQRFGAERRRSLIGVLVHMAEHAFGPGVTCVAAPWSDRAVALVFGLSPEADPSPLSELLSSGFEALKQEALPAIETSLTLCLDPRPTAPSALADAWTLCHGLARRRFLSGYGRLFYHQEPSPTGSTLFPRQEIRNVLAALESGDQGEFEAPLEALAQSLRSRPGLSYDNAILIYSQVVSGLIRYLIDLSLGVDQVYGPGVDLQAELAATETLEDAQRWLRARLTMAMTSLRKDPPSHHAGLVVAYLQENFRRDFGIEEVADHVGLSYSHVRKVFQEEFGDSIVGYVNTLRIEEAKRLLLDTELNLEAIAHESGYNNIQSLNRYFKKFTGQTPGEFRSLRRHR